MAHTLLSHEVSDLCIGKPPLKSIPIAATVADALFALKLWGDSLIIRKPETSNSIVGKICMVDILCYLCSEPNVASPSSALENPISSLLHKDSDSHLRIVKPNSSILDALELFLDGKTQTILVPISASSYSKRHNNGHQPELCCLTQEDLVRFFLNNIFLFSSVADLSISSLGLVRPVLLSIFHHDPAISSLPLIRSALDANSSVPVITSDGKLIGEISPSTLSTCDEKAAPAIAALSARDLMAYIDSCNGGSLPESIVQAVRNRLIKKQGMKGMLELMGGGGESNRALSRCSSCSVSSDEEGGEGVKRNRRRRSGSYSTRMGRKSEEAIVCHPESSLVAVMVQALAHRVSYVWVVQEVDYGLLGIVSFEDVLRVFKEQVV